MFVLYDLYDLFNLKCINGFQKEYYIHLNDLYLKYSYN